MKDKAEVTLHRSIPLKEASKASFCYHKNMKPQTFDEYMDSFSGEQRIRLSELRKIIQETLSDTDEAIKWGAPAILDKDGMILMVFSGHKHHINLVGTPSMKEALKNELDDYETGKGSVKLSYDKPLPKNLIKKMVKYRADEYRSRGVKWK